MKKVIKSVAFFISLILIAVYADAGVLPDTGQSNCYDNEGEITCPQPGESFYGQDSNYTINPPFFTKLDSSGNPLPYSATSWVMVLDNNTGLIWEAKTDDDSVHDKDNRYTWQQATDVFINNLDTNTFGGHSDWRLPTIKELAYLLDRSNYYPAIDLDYFPYTIYSDSSTSWYWSSTSSASDNTEAWAVKFFHGFIGPGSKGYSLHVRAVRGNQIPDSPSSFHDNGNNTVTDTNTGLMWQQLPSGMSWESSLSYCENLSHGGFGDWRLPNTNELISIVDFGQFSPAVNTTYFQNSSANCGGIYYWSSSTYAFSHSQAWCLGTEIGTVDTQWARKDYSNCTRCARGPDPPPETVQVDIDIRPNTCPNECHIKKRRCLPVAILGTEAFNAVDVDPTTIEMEGIAPTRWSVEDVSTPVIDPQDVCDCTEDGADGFDDLLLKFDFQEIVAQLGELNDGDVFPSMLTGELTDGTPIEGTDCMVVLDTCQMHICSSLSGRVRDKRTGRPIHNAKVILKENCVESQKDMTNWRGRYRIRNIESGIYDLFKVRKKGYKTYRRRGIMIEGDVVKNVRLRRR